MGRATPARARTRIEIKPSMRVSPRSEADWTARWFFRAYTSRSIHETALKVPSRELPYQFRGTVRGPAPRFKPCGVRCPEAGTTRQASPSSCAARPCAARPCAARYHWAVPSRACGDRHHPGDHRFFARRRRKDRSLGVSHCRSLCMLNTAVAHIDAS